VLDENMGGGQSRGDFNMKLFIEGRRDGYATEQCRETMTVKELIARLEDYDENTLVYLKNDGGYTFGSIDEWSFSESENGEE
jgi:hypothetical protein